jgi:hypothetical protein
MPGQMIALRITEQIHVLKTVYISWRIKKQSDKSPTSLSYEWLTMEEMSEKQRAQVRSTSIQHTYDKTSFIQGKS